MVNSAMSHDNISNQKSLLPQIEQAKKEWEATVDALPQLICLLDKKGKVIRANRTLERWQLATVYSVRGLSLHEILHPECSETPCEVATIWEQAFPDLNNQQDFDIEVSDTLRNCIYHVQLQAIKSQVKNEGSFASLIITDVTKRKALEAQLHDYVTQAALLHEIEVELTHSLEVETVLRVALRSLHAISNADKGIVIQIDDDDNIAKRYAINCSEEDIQQFKATTSEQIQNHDIITDHVSENEMILALISRDKVVGIIYLEAHSADKFSDGAHQFAISIAARIASALDNAQLYQLSQRQVNKLQVLNTEIKALEQLKTDMIRLASHDLRNPMAAIQLSADIISRYAKKELSEMQIRHLDTIQSAVEGMKVITNDILSLERIETMRKQDLAPVDLRLLASEAFADFQMQAENKSHQYEIELPPTALTVNGNAALLREVMCNFISNAIKYTADRGQIVVRLQHKSDRVTFEVQDTGYGIPEEQQDKLFEPFYRAKNETTSQIEGTGLGLNLTKNIIERFNGTVHYESLFGQGSTFGFSLPTWRES
ncbi:MAG: ATP-binding protein [Anaerolineae bacterium]|nr:ATP-binding protein [Anaerolineae bacterium]